MGEQPHESNARHRVIIVVFDGVQSLDVTGPAEVFAGADELLRSSSSPDRGYEVTIVSLGAESVTTERAIAQRCGFGTAETLRRALHRHIGISPEGYRARFTHQPPTTRRTSHAPANGYSPVPPVHRA